jgi:hypothetical protein
VINALTIVLTAVSGAVAFYLTSSLLLAQKQLVAATRLSGYLAYWQNWFLENEMFALYFMGMKWNEELREVVKKHGGEKEALKLREEKKKLLSQMKEEIEKRGVEYGVAKIADDIRRLPKEQIVTVLESFKSSSQNIIDGKTFISDEEAASLGVAFAHNSIELKMILVDLLDSATMMLVASTSTVSAPANLDIKDFSNELSQIMWKGILVSKNIDLLARSARAIASKSVLALTLQNIRTGSRLTRR